MADFFVNIATQGSEKVNADLNKILKAAMATTGSITALAQTLNTSANSAAAFANKLGLSAAQTSAAISKYQALKNAGSDNATTFKALNQELGLNATQYKNLVVGLKDVDRQVDAYNASLKAQIDAQNQAQKSTEAQLIALQQINQFAQQVANSLQAFSGQAVSAFIEYDDALNIVAAKAGVTKDQLGFLEDAARDVALATSQSPVSALKAADALIALGASAQESADRLMVVGQLTDALRTVGATAEQSAKVIQLAMGIYEDFGVSAEDVGNKVAVLSDTTATASSTGLNEFMQLFSKAGALAAELGMSMDELLALFGELRDAGQAPEVAATSLKSLISETISSRKELEALGITVFSVGADGQEKFVGLTNIMQQIGEAGLSTSEKINIFGKIGIASATILSKEYQSVNDRILQLSGTTNELATKSAIINSSIKGQIELLQGSIETVFIELGQGLSSLAGPSIDVSLKIVNAFIDSSDAAKKFFTVLVGGGTAIATLTIGVTGLALAIKAWEAANVAATIKAGYAALATGAQTFATGLNTKAKVLNTTVTWANTTATLKNVQAYVASSFAAATSAKSLTALSAALASIKASLLAVAPLFTVVTAGIAGIAVGGEISKTVNELKELNTEVESLGNGAAAQVDSVNKVSIGLRDVTAEINTLREKGLDVSDELLKKQQQYILLGRQSLDEIQLEIDLRKQLIAAIEAGNKGQLDGFGLGKLNKGQQEALLNSLKLQVAELSIANGVLERQIVAAGGVKEEAKGIADELENATSAAEKLETALAGAETEANRKRIAAYEDFVGDAEGLEKRLSEVNIEELQARLTAQQAYFSALKAEKQISNEDILKADREVRAAERALANEVNEENRADLEQQLADKQNYLAKLKTDKEASKDELLKAEEDLVSAELALTQAKADQQKEIEQESAKIREEAEAEFLERQKERIETEKALRQAAYDEEVRQIEDLKNQAELAAQARIDAQNAVLESLDDQSTAIADQTSLLELQLSNQQILSDAKIARLDEEINALGNVSRLIEAINSNELDREQLLVAQNELRRLGLTAQSSEAEVLDAIKQKTIEKQDIEAKAFQAKQLGEKALLELSQAQQRIELQRSLTQARIAEIEAQSLVTQAEINAKAEERLLNYNKLQLAAAIAEGASQSELIALQGQVQASEDSLALAQSQIPLAQQGVELAGQQVRDAENAVVAGEKLFDAQGKNLDLAQKAALEAFLAAQNTERLGTALGGAADGANDTADGLERAATASERLAQEAQRVSDELDKSIQLLNSQTKIQNAEQAKILDSLDAQSESLTQQKSILENQLETQELLANRRIEQIESEIQGLESASELIEAIKSGEIDKEESLLAQQELRRLGLTDQSTEVEIAELLKQKKEEQRQIEVEALERKQAGEKSILQLQQAQGRVALQRQLTQAKIEESEARSLVLQAQLRIAAQEQLLTLKQQELSAARSAKASEEQLASLGRAVQSQRVSLEIAKTELPLVQEQARLASQQVSDAKAAITAAEQLFQAQAQQLAIAQDLEKSRLESAQNAERLAEATQKSAENTDKLDKALISLYDRIKAAKDEIKSLTPDDEGYEKSLQDLEILEQQRISLIYQYRVDELSAVLEISKGVLEKSLADIEYQYAQQLTTEDEYNQARLDAQKGFIDQQIEIKNREIELLGRGREDQSQALLELTNLETERIKLLHQFRVEQLEEVLSDSKLVIDNSLSEIENQYAQGLVNEEQYNQRRLEIQLKSLSDQIDIKNQELALYAEGSDEQTQLLTELRNLETERINVLEEFRVNQLKNVLENSQSIIEEYELQDDLDAVNEKTVELLERQNSLFKLEQEREALLREQRLVQLDQELEKLKEGEALLQKINDREFNKEQIILAQNRLREIGIDLDISAEALASKRLDILEEQIVAERENFEQQQAAQVAQLQVAQELERIGLRRQAIEAEIARLQAANTLALAEQSGIESLVQTAERSLEAAEQLVAAVDETLAYFDATAAKQLENLLLTQQLADAQRDAADEAERFAIAIERAERPGTSVTTQTERRSSIPGRASGGPVSAGQPYIVGEEGVEVFVPDSAGQIIPNDKLSIRKSRDTSTESVEKRVSLLDKARLIQREQVQLSERISALSAEQNEQSRAEQQERSQLIRLNEQRIDQEKTILKLTKEQWIVREQAVSNDQDEQTRQEQQAWNAIRIPGRASGGPVSAGQPYIVGERRPELFVPRVPGTIVPRVPQMAGGGGDLSKVEALLTQLVNRPLPTVNAPATFINQPNPLQTQIELLQGQLRAARGAF